MSNKACRYRNTYWQKKQLCNSNHNRDIYLHGILKLILKAIADDISKAC